MLLTSPSVVFTLKRGQKALREHKDEPESCSSVHTLLRCDGVTETDEEQKWEETIQLNALRSQWPEKMASKEKEKHQQMPRNSVVFFQCPLSLHPLHVSSEKFVGAFQGFMSAAAA